METQVVVINLTATVFVEAESPEAAAAIVQDRLADVDAEVAGFKLRLGMGDLSATKAFAEGTDPPGDD